MPPATSMFDQGLYELIHQSRLRFKPFLLLSITFDLQIAIDLLLQLTALVILGSQVIFVKVVYSTSSTVNGALPALIVLFTVDSYCIVHVADFYLYLWCRRCWLHYYRNLMLRGVFHMCHCVSFALCYIIYSFIDVTGFATSTFVLECNFYIVQFV